METIPEASVAALAATDADAQPIRHINYVPHHHIVDNRPYTTNTTMSHEGYVYSAEILGISPRLLGRGKSLVALSIGLKYKH